MDMHLPDLTSSQWDFLAILEAFGQPSSVDILYELVPLSPGELINLISTTKEIGWITQDENNTLAFKDPLPKAVVDKLRKINTAGRISALQKRIQELGLDKRISTRIRTNLLSRSGHEYEAAVMEYDFALKAIEQRNFGIALEHIERTLSSLKRGLGDRDFDMLFVQASLTLSNIRRRLKKGLSEIPKVLEQARIAAERQGDRRARALVNLHIGRNFVFLDKRDEALPLLEAGLEEVNDLGDKDIVSQSAEFVGIFYFIQGLYRDAIDYFETALHSDTTGRAYQINPGLPVLLAYSAFLTGQYSRAIGVLDCHWRLALMESDRVSATTYRTSLGLILLLMGYKSQAIHHLERAMEEARAQDNYWSLYEAEGGLAYYHFIEGHLQEAYETAVRVWSQSAQADPFSRRPIWAHGRRMFYEFYKQGYPPVPGYDFKEEMERILSGVNVHLRGVILRIQAQMAMEENRDLSEIETLLEKSEADLKRSGDPIYLAKTRIDLSRLKIRRGDRDGARRLALQAWELLSGYPHETFPEDLMLLLEISPQSKEQGKREDILNRFMKMLDEFFPCTNMEEFYYRIVVSACRFIEAERGGLFVFDKGVPYLKAGYNLAQAEVETESFRFSIEQVIKAHKNNRPLVVNLKQTETKDVSPSTVSSILCLPFEQESTHLKGVLYYDSTYEDKDFELYGMHILRRISSYLSTSADRFNDYFHALEKSSLHEPEESLPVPHMEDWEIKAQSPIMKDLLDRAHRVADSEASVLILGETGVGKELLARHIHAMSPYRSGPFIEIDLSSIPETLVESELFGHEKGAFTGADHQKKGRMELAHKGTLFIDEVGDIPKAIQIKLLRALQEKTFVRVGGTRKLTSDFRLIAATNRDLEKAVEEGDFREDLYYRLNVVPLTVPALKERGRDVLILAQHFLEHYARKYKRRNLAFRDDDKASLREYHWPGNVRELKNVIERAVILSSGATPELKLPMGAKPDPSDQFAARPTLEGLQRMYINHILNKTGGRISGPGGAAEILGIKRTTLYSRMKNLGLV